MSRRLAQGVDASSAAPTAHTVHAVVALGANLGDRVAALQGAVDLLAPLLRDAAARARAGAEYFGGQWTDVGTPQRLAELDAQLTLATRLRSPGTPA